MYVLPILVNTTRDPKLSFLDHVLLELSSRFTEETQLSLPKGHVIIPSQVNNSLPWKDEFLTFAEIYKEDLPFPGSIDAELETWSLYWSRQDYLPSTSRETLRGGWSIFFFRWFCRKKIITNSYFIFFFMFICQNVGNLKGFLLASLHGLYLITLSSYSSTGRGTSSSNKKTKKQK